MPDSSDSDQMAAEPTPTTPQKKTPAKCQACTNCRQKKIKCDGSKPTCAACLRNAAECQYVPSRRRGRPARVHREYERPYANPLPILPRQQQQHDVKYQPPLQQLAPNRVLPTLPHLQPQPAPTIPSTSTASSRAHVHQHQQIAPLGSILAAALFPSSPHYVSEDDAANTHHHHNNNRSSGSESPLPPYVRPPPFLVPGGDRGGHQTMTQATPLVIPRPSTFHTNNTNVVAAATTNAATTLYVDPNIIEFFHYFNALYPIVHWPSFREAYDDGTVPNYLVLAIRALSKRYSKQPSVVLSGQLYSAGQDLAAIATSLAE
ncbi:hypothetical protein GGI21_004560, partial [Coemansia aciculifera]